MRWRGAFVIVFAVLAASPNTVCGYNPKETFRKGAYVLSVERGGGDQDDVAPHPDETGLKFLNGRAAVVPAVLTDLSRAGVRCARDRARAIRSGYADPVRAYYDGLAAVGRYHFLSLGRFVPYFEVGGATGGTTLRVREIDSTFAFLVFGGLGASYFLNDRTALYVGYRIQHVSNGGSSGPALSRPFRRSA